MLRQISITIMIENAVEEGDHSCNDTLPLTNKKDARSRTSSMVNKWFLFFDDKFSHYCIVLIAYLDKINAILQCFQ